MCFVSESTNHVYSLTIFSIILLLCERVYCHIIMCILLLSCVLYYLMYIVLLPCGSQWHVYCFTVMSIVLMLCVLSSCNVYYLTAMWSFIMACGLSFCINIMLFPYYLLYCIVSEIGWFSSYLDDRHRAFSLCFFRSRLDSIIYIFLWVKTAKDNI